MIQDRSVILVGNAMTCCRLICGRAIRALCLSILVVASLGLHSERCAADGTQSALKGLTEVVLDVSAFGTKWRPQLLLLPSELEALGVKLVSEDAAPPSTPHLSLTFSLTCSTACGYSVELELTEPVRINRRPNMEVVATTWSNGFTGLGIRRQDVDSSLVDEYEARAEDLIKSFAKDFKAANAPAARTGATK